jgi:hypothetical protein
VEAGVLVSAAGQRGQALVAVMVVMLVLFALAGAVAIAASTLLTDRGRSDVSNGDFQVRSAVNDTVAQIALQPLRCGAPPPLPSPVPTPMPTPTTSPLNVDHLPSGARPQALCARQDDVVLSSLHRIQPTGGCATVPLPADGRVAVLFDLRTADAGWAYLDKSSASASCADAVPDTTQTPPCLASWPSTTDATVRQVALTCDFAAGDQVFLHLNAASAPGHVFTAKRNDRGQPNAVGRLFLIATGTGVDSPDYEESLYFTSVDGSVRHLLFEAPLG